MFALFLKGYRDITNRRLRSLLTLAGIVIGVAGVVAIASTGQNLAHAQAAAYTNASQADISFWVWEAPPSTERAVESLANVSVAELRGDYFTRCQITENNGSSAKAESPADSQSSDPETARGISGQRRDVLMHGVEDFASARVDQVFLRAGRWPSEGEFVAEQSALDVGSLQLGDTVSCRGRNGTFGEPLLLVGVVQTPNYPSASLLDYLTFYTTSSDLQKLLDTSGANSLLLKIKDVTRARETANAVTQLLDRRNITHGTPVIRDPENFLGKRELDALLLLLSVFSAVGLITSGFLVANTLAAIAAEQVGEIGTIKAIGGTSGQVLTIYVFSALLYGIIGTALGLIVGVVLSWQLLGYVGSLLNLTIGLDIAPISIALGAAVGIGVTLIAGAVPAYTATTIPVKRALDSHGITSTYGQGRADRLIRRVVALPPLAAMSLRNLARRKGRALVTMFVIAVAVAASLAAQTVSASVDNAIDNLFHTYRADAWLWFGEYVSTSMASQIEAVPGVQQAEIWSLDDAWVSRETNVGTKAARARVWGLPDDTILYSPKLAQGRWYQPDENDAAVISSDLAASLNLNVGDGISVASGDDPRSFTIVGIAVDNSVFLGSQVTGKVFLREDIVAQMQRREGYATFFALGLDRHDLDGVDQRLDDISKRFNRYQVGSDSAAREVRGAKEQTRILTIALAAMSILVGIIGALGVLNTLTLNVLERRREIGVLRAIGAGDASLIQTFLTEGLAFGVGGWVLGVIIGYPLGAILTRVMESVLFHIDYIFDARMILVSLVFALLLSIAASLVPALAAARLKVGQVLRYE